MLEMQTIGDYRGDQPELDQHQNQKPVSTNLSFSDRFNKISQEKKNQPQEQKEESNLDFIKRNASRLGARAYETALGYAGNFKKAYTQATDYFDSFIPEGMTNLKQLREQEREAFGEQHIGTGSHYLFNPPTSSDIRSQVTPIISKKLTGKEDYLESKSENEKIADEVASDITSFFLPGTGQMRMVTRIGAPIVGNLAKQGAKFLGSDEQTAEKTKLGFMLATTLASQSNPGQFASNRIQQAKQMIPDSATVSVQPFFSRLQNLHDRLTRGLKVPSKSRTAQGIEDLAGQVQNGRMTMRSLMDARDNINEWIAEAGGWDVPVTTRNATLANLNELKTNIIRTIDENMATRFPQAGELYRTGYEAAAVTHQSNAISRFIEKHFGKKAASVGAKLLFPGLAGGAAILPKTVGVAGLTLPIYKAGQVLYRVGNSPTLARYYSDVLRHSASGNVPAMIKSMDLLDSELEKDEKKEMKNHVPSLDEFKSKFKNMG